MVAGFPLDNAFARFISDLTQTGVVFSRESGDQQQELASSFEVDATKMPDTTDAPTQQNIVETQGFFTRALVLGDREQSQLRALLLIDRAEALEAYYALAIEIALLTLGALAVAVILVLFVARALGRPVLELAHFALAIGENRDAAHPGALVAVNWPYCRRPCPKCSAGSGTVNTRSATMPNTTNSATFPTVRPWNSSSRATVRRGRH